MQRKRANRFSTGVSIASAGKSKTAYETCARFEVFAGMSGHGDQKLVAAGGEDIGRFANRCSVEVGHHAVVVRRIVAVRFRL